MNNKKVVSVSIWHFLLRLIFIDLPLFFVLFLVVMMLIYMMVGQVDSGVTISLIISGVITLVLILGDLLYWRMTGIYVNEHGDHIFKLGGWFIKEDKLLNGVIIANQVSRNPIDLVFGTASIRAGIFGNKIIRGVKYKEISKYDDLMREASSGVFTTMF